MVVIKLCVMKYIVIIVLIAFAAAPAMTGCKKKKSGVCYCKYLSGDKKEFDLTSLGRSKAEDSCAVLNRNASAFAGDCKLK